MEADERLRPDRWLARSWDNRRCWCPVWFTVCPSVIYAVIYAIIHPLVLPGTRGMFCFSLCGRVSSFISPELQTLWCQDHRSRSEWAEMGWNKHEFDKAVQFRSIKSLHIDWDLTVSQIGFGLDLRLHPVFQPWMESTRSEEEKKSTYCSSVSPSSRQTVLKVSARPLDGLEFEI